MSQTVRGVSSRKKGEPVGLVDDVVVDLMACGRAFAKMHSGHNGDVLRSVVTL